MHSGSAVFIWSGMGGVKKACGVVWCGVVWCGRESTVNYQLRR